MPAAYEAMRDKFAKTMPLADAKTKAAKIYNSQHHDNPVTRATPAEERKSMIRSPKKEK